MKKIVRLKDVDPILFSGIDDVNLKAIEKKFLETKFVLRGNELVLDGKKKALDNIESLINDIIYTINIKGYLCGRTFIIS